MSPQLCTGLLMGQKPFSVTEVQQDPLGAARPGSELCECWQSPHSLNRAETSRSTIFLQQELCLCHLGAAVPRAGLPGLMKRRVS